MLKIIVRVLKLFILGCFILTLFSIMALFYAIKVEPYLIKKDIVNLQTELADDIKIAQISDIQINESFTPEHLKKVIDFLNLQKPDIVLFTGDLYENYSEFHEDERLIEILSSKSTYGKYAIWGNRDRGGVFQEYLKC